MMRRPNAGAKLDWTTDLLLLLSLSLQQGSPKYLSFAEPFGLSLNGTNTTVPLTASTRQTLVILENNGGLVYYKQVRRSTPVTSATSFLPFCLAASRDLLSDADVYLIISYCLNLYNYFFAAAFNSLQHHACLCPQFEDINAKPEEGNNDMRQVLCLF